MGVQPTLDSLALRDAKQSLDCVGYWAERAVDRLEFAKEILRRLDQRGWPNKPDIGWSDYDVEVHDQRWSKLQITTLVEEHPGQRRLIRCRLRPGWALRGRVGFFVLCGVELLVCGLLARQHPWLWLLLLTLPAYVWFLRREQRSLQSMIVVFLDELAEEWKLTKVQG